jgi:hypothetical protein
VIEIKRVGVLTFQQMDEAQGEVQSEPQGEVQSEPQGGP